MQRLLSGESVRNKVKCNQTSFSEQLEEGKKPFFVDKRWGWGRWAGGIFKLFRHKKRDRVFFRARLHGSGQILFLDNLFA